MAKTAQGLVEYCKAQLGRPYWFGTFGQISTAELYEQKKLQYPEYYTATNFLQQLKVKVHDCVGLIKGYLWSASPNAPAVYNPAQDVAVGGLYAVCDRKGAISGIPEIPGVCVFMANMGHVGVYIGNGQVIEAMGHAYGVKQTALKGRGWAYWGMPRWIDYDGKDNDVSTKPETDKPSTPVTIRPAYTYDVKLPLLKVGSAGQSVESLQQLLIAKGYTCGGYGADGEFGTGTLVSVKDYQEANGLDADGEVGEKTWTKLLRG